LLAQELSDVLVRDEAHPGESISESDVVFSLCFLRGTQLLEIDQLLADKQLSKPIAHLKSSPPKKGKISHAPLPGYLKDSSGLASKTNGNSYTPCPSWCYDKLCGKRSEDLGKQGP